MSKCYYIAEKFLRPQTCLRTGIVLALLSVSAALFSQNQAFNELGGSRGAFEIDSQEAYFIGRGVAAALLGRYPVYTGHPEYTAYLNAICSVLAINSPLPDPFNGYHVLILDSDEINAFATTGGHIFLTRALVACADSEDALAAVIAHEIAHIQLRHSIAIIKSSRAIERLDAIGAEAERITGARLDAELRVFDQTVTQVMNTLLYNGYSRAQEFQADETAVSLLVSAGYNPQALAAVLKQLEKNQRNAPRSGFRTTHPSPGQRTARLESVIQSYRINDTASFRRSRFRALWNSFQGRR